MPEDINSIFGNGKEFCDHQFSFCLDKEMLLKNHMLETTSQTLIFCHNLSLAMSKFALVSLKTFQIVPDSK